MKIKGGKNANKAEFALILHKYWTKVSAIIVEI